MQLLSFGDANPKIWKSDKSGKGYNTALLSLAPYTEAGGRNLCPCASEGCKKSCLYRSGRGRTFKIQKQRVAKTKFYLEHPTEFMLKLTREISGFHVKNKAAGLKTAIRLNGMSDIVWEQEIPTLFQHFYAIDSDIQFYDYTKIFQRLSPDWKYKQPNYELVFSRSETNEADCLKVLEMGGRVSIVFRKELPANWNGYPVVCGDDDDLIFLKPKGHVIGLVAKGPARKDTSGFVLDVVKEASQ